MRSFQLVTYRFGNPWSMVIIMRLESSIKFQIVCFMGGENASREINVPLIGGVAVELVHSLTAKFS